MSKSKNIYLIEGFSMVGRSTFIDTAFPASPMYTWNNNHVDELNNRNEWNVEYGIIDFLEQVGVRRVANSTGLVLNRGVFSSYVYNYLYSRSRPFDERILESYKNNKFFHNDIGHIYVRHSDQGLAEEMFNKAHEQYPEFKSFSDYWIMYNYADQCYRDIYKKLGITPEIYETIPDLKWRKVN